MGNISLNLLSLLLISHFLGDFYFKIKTPHKSKKRQIGYLIVQILMYSIPFFVLNTILFLFFGNGRIQIKLALACIVAHLIIRIISLLISRCFLRKKWGFKIERYNFVIDQILHLIALTFIFYLFSQQVKFYISTQIINDYISYFLFGLLLLRVANVLMIKVFSSFVPDKSNKTGKLGAGAMIGNLERVACGIFLIISQYASK